MTNKSLEQLTNNDFLEAQNNPYRRKSFVERIDYSPIEKYTKEIIYIKETELLFSNTIMAAHHSSKLSDLIFRPKKIKSNILVFNLAFSNEVHKNIDDFFGTLYYHEGLHAREWYEDPKSIKNNFFVSVTNSIFIVSLMGPFSNEKDIYKKHPDYKKELESEIRAYENQLKNLNDRNSTSYREKLQEDLELINKELKFIS